MKILRVIATVDSASGGPVAGLRAVTPLLARLGHTTEFATVDTPSAEFLKSWVGPTHAFGPVTNRFGYAPLLEPWLREHARDYDAIFVHGLWQYLGRTVRRVLHEVGGPPYFVFPHGMLDPALKRAYPVRHFKKWLYWLLAERKVLRDARAVFFTCEEERRLASQSFPFYHCTERVVAYGAAVPEGDALGWAQAWQKHCPTTAERPYFLFLSRIHSKKGVDLLLHAYDRLVDETSSDQRESLPDLVIAGPCEDLAYLASLKKLVTKEACARKIHWPGMLNGPVKWGALNNAEAFVLPSHQENFGIAVVEALACGVPVLISNRVNIWTELVADSTALVEPDNRAGTFRLLQRWLALPAETRKTMSAAARVSFKKRFEISQAAENLAAQLTELVGRSSVSSR